MLQVVIIRAIRTTLQFAIARRGEAPGESLDLVVERAADDQMMTEFIVIPQEIGFQLAVSHRPYLAVHVDALGKLVARRGEGSVFHHSGFDLSTGGRAVSAEREGGPVIATFEPGQYCQFDLFPTRTVDSTCVKRRIPESHVLELTDDDHRAALSKNLWEELKESLFVEATEFKQTGKLVIASPRRDASPLRSARSTEAVPNDKAASRPNQYFGLRRIFNAVGETGGAPSKFPGLERLHAAATAAAGRQIFWPVASDLHARIAERQKAFDDRQKSRTEYARQLRQSQQPEDGTPKSSTKSDALDAIKDQTAINEIERRAKDEEARAKISEERAALDLAAQKEKIAQQRAARKAEREARLKALHDAEEDTLDVLEAANRVRAQWDLAKQRAAENDDVSLLENY